MLAFTLDIHAYGLPNLIGHLFKIVSFYLLYKAFVEVGLSQPYRLLFRDLKQSQEKLHRALETSQQRQVEVSSLLEGARAVLEHHEFEIDLPCL